MSGRRMGRTIKHKLMTARNDICAKPRKYEPPEEMRRKRQTDLGKERNTPKTRLTTTNSRGRQGLWAPPNRGGGRRALDIYAIKTEMLGHGNTNTKVRRYLGTQTLMTRLTAPRSPLHAPATPRPQPLPAPATSGPPPLTGRFNGASCILLSSR